MESSDTGCSECGKPTQFYRDLAEGNIKLCIDCNLKLEEIISRQNDRDERAMNFAMADMKAQAASLGVDLPVAYYPHRKPTQKITMHNINVHNSQVGVLNTGSFNAVDSSIGILKSRNSSDLGEALKQFTEALVGSEIPPDDKNQVLEMLGAVSVEATKPEKDRRTAVIASLAKSISDYVNASSGLVGLWRAVEFLLKALP